MALFGSARDASLVRHINREFLGNIVSQQAAFYKFRIDKNNINIYGESAGIKHYMGPVLFYCLVQREGQTFQGSDNLSTIDFGWKIDFKFLRDDLVDGNYVPEVGDIILYQERYYEVDNIVANQYFEGKNPDYPNSVNPLNPGLENFGYNLSIICETHVIPSDKVAITNERPI
jgi:hypothetical protein